MRKNKKGRKRETRIKYFDMLSIYFKDITLSIYVKLLEHIHTKNSTLNFSTTWIFLIPGKRYPAVMAQSYWQYKQSARYLSQAF